MKVGAKFFVCPPPPRRGRRPAAISNDLCVCSPTGSGKTLSYALPIVQCLLGHAVRRVRCLVGRLLSKKRFTPTDFLKIGPGGSEVGGYISPSWRGGGGGGWTE